MAHAALQELLTAKSKVAVEYKKRGTKFFCGTTPGIEFAYSGIFQGGGLTFFSCLRNMKENIC